MKEMYTGEKMRKKTKEREEIWIENSGENRAGEKNRRDREGKAKKEWE